jgi:23S rRNA (guanosine2251-2'-O)-methyltransferase
MLIMKEMTYIYGRHAVLEALRRRSDLVSRVIVQKEHLTEPEIMIALKNVKEVVELNEKKLPGGIQKDAVHQGFIAVIEADKLLLPFKTFKDKLNVTPDTALLVLGEVQDPHNVGAIIRSAAAFGFAGVLIPEHRQAPITGTVIKVSAGMAFSIPLITIKNVNAALRDLKDKGFWVYGLDMNGDTALTVEEFKKPTVIVVGNEGEGIRQKTAELCDTILTIPMHKRTESLNASVGAAVAMYAFSAKHPGALN